MVNTSMHHRRYAAVAGHDRHVMDVQEAVYLEGYGDMMDERLGHSEGRKIRMRRLEGLDNHFFLRVRDSNIF